MNLNVKGTEKEVFASSDEDFELWWLMIQARRAMDKVRARELFRYGVTPQEATILFVVQVIGQRATPAEISRWILREPHSVSTLLTRMENEGLLRRTKDLERKNLVRVELTEKGKQASRLVAKRNSVHRLMSSLNREERLKLKAYLLKLRDKALEELRIDYKPPFPPSD